MSELTSTVTGTALVFEGGGMRASYTSGLVVALLEAGLHLDWVGGISAGSSNTANYVSRDAWRARHSFTDFAADPRFGDWRTFVRGQGLFNARYIYEETGLPGAARLMEAVVVIALLSAFNANVYATSRMAYSLAGRGDGPAVVTPLTWLLLERAVHPTIAVRDVELEIGDLDMAADPDGTLAAEAAAAGRTDSPYAGGAVALLQSLLGVDDDGTFGPKTEAAVKDLQDGAEIEPTGVVDGPTWVALEKEALEEGRVPEGPGAAVAHERERVKEAKAKKAAEAKKKAEKKAEEKARRAELRAERHTAAVADAS